MIKEPKAPGQGIVLVTNYLRNLNPKNPLNWPMQTDIARVTAEEAALRADVGKMTAERDGAWGEIKVLRGQVAALERTVAGLKEDGARRQKENEDAFTRNSVLSKEKEAIGKVNLGLTLHLCRHTPRRRCDALAFWCWRLAPPPAVAHEFAMVHEFAMQSSASGTVIIRRCTNRHHLSRTKRAPRSF